MYDLKSFTFTHGSHQSREQGMCVMEAVAYVAGEAHSDHPKCACPIITAFLISWNDALPSDTERNRLLSRFVFRLPGTKATAEIEQRRSFMALDWLVRICTPAWLDLRPELASHAKALRSVKRIKDMETALNARAAAYAAARAATYDAARAATIAAAYDAVNPTMAKLQLSAQRLVDRMIRLTEIRERRIVAAQKETRA